MSRNLKQTKRPASFRLLRSWHEGPTEDLATYASWTNFLVPPTDSILLSEPESDTSWIQDLRDKVLAVTNAPPEGNALK